MTRRLQELQAQVAAVRSDVDALLAQSWQSSDRADASEVRSEEIRHWASDDRDRIDALQKWAEVDRVILRYLPAEGLIDKLTVSQLQVALQTARRIGAAIGIIMATCKVSDEAAFEMLRGASRDTNRKLRVVADEVVQTGDLSHLPDITRQVRAEG